MAQPLLTKRKTEAISNGVFLICLAILFYTDKWWPGILLAIWVTLGIRQLGSGRIYDFAIASIILLTLFAINILPITFSILMPILFLIGGIYIIFREFFFPEDTNGEDKSQEIKEDTEDGNHPS